MAATLPAEELERLRAHFERFAEMECAELPLYRRLCLATANDDALLALYAHTPPAQRRANLLLAAVHDLLLSGVDDPLADWYPSVRPGARPVGDPYPAWREFIHAHEPAIVTTLATRTTQTNEVNRSCLWFVALRHVCAPEQTVGLVEVGASAGLNLAFDRYAYNFGDHGSSAHRGGDGGGEGGRLRGDATSTVRLSSTMLGDAAPLDEPAPHIGARVGLDAAPVDVRDPIAARWLQACVWPEQIERHHRLRAALEVALPDPPRVVAGDALDDLEACIATWITGDRTAGNAVDLDVDHVVIVNSWALTYLPTPRRAQFETVLDRLGGECRHAGRDLTWISAEHPGCMPAFRSRSADKLTSATLVGVRRWRADGRTTGLLGEVHPHLAWTRWSPRRLTDGGT